MPDSSGTPTLLVVSAHAADFVWRCAGTIALYRQRGARVRLLVLSYGERGESAEQWKQPGATLETVKANRHEESAAAAEALGVLDDTRFFDLGDYPMQVDDAALEELMLEFRSVRPDSVLTHGPKDPYNMDHEQASRVTLTARVLAQAHGMRPEVPIIGAPRVFAFEPHQSEMCDFKPNTYVDITPVWETKLQAMRCMKTQQHLWDYYTWLGQRRGVLAVRNGGAKDIRYAEAFMDYYPYVGAGFP